ncbi:uncharacterized protein LOC120573118 isoform X2 [Perca fluviatilis]|uniref:uncharacterized protein LOC120573118 isoform X2 n=1 Tax=Perca fluviatilis TaxID=8168 RepID=UPI001963275E|nr:uncharacterized protein LOC120573118 isoform X2 [Perca fluviatilis]
MQRRNQTQTRTLSSGLLVWILNDWRHTRQKMICSILLLIILTSCVSGTFVVNVTQTSYQAEENHDITLEWTFTTNPHTSSNSPYIFCELITDLKNQTLFCLNEGVESQDKQFTGRVQWDKDVLREGRLRLHVSRLRTEDSGLYLCDVLTSYGRNSGRCLLNVTDADEPKPQRPEPKSLENIRILYAGLAVLTAAVLLIICLCFKCNNKKRNI